MKAIAILSQKGGAGKSTVAIHLAAAAYQDGQTAVIADLDSQASASDWHAARLKNGGDPLPHVSKTNPNSIGSLVEAAKRQGVDFLILDTPPKSDKEAIAAAELADLVIMVSTPSAMDLRAMKNTIKLTRIAKLKPGAQVVLALNMMRPLGAAAADAAAALRELEVNVLPVGFGNRVAFEYCLIKGETALEYEPDGKADKEAQAFYKHVCKLVDKSTRRHRTGRKAYEKIEAYA